MIIPGVPIDIDVESENVVNGIIQLNEAEKIYCFNLTPIAVRGEAPRIDLKVYMSMYYKDPDEYRSDKFVQNVK
jgi:hypothetical protein